MAAKKTIEALEKVEETKKKSGKKTNDSEVVDSMKKSETEDALVSHVETNEEVIAENSTEFDGVVNHLETTYVANNAESVTEEVESSEQIDGNEEEDVEEPLTKEIVEEQKEEVNGEEDVFVEDFSNPSSKLQELVDANPGNVEKALREEIDRVSEVEKKMAETIKKNESKLDKKQKSILDTLFRRGFGDYWNGVSSGWED